MSVENVSGNVVIEQDKAPWFQWDTGLTVTVGGGTMDECHFANKKQGFAYTQAVIDNQARVPDELLQVAAPIHVWGYVIDADGGQTYVEAIFDVTARNMPADYTYTKTGQKTIHDAEKARDAAREAQAAAEAARDESKASAAASATSATESASSANASAASAAQAGESAASASASAEKAATSETNAAASAKSAKDSLDGTLDYAQQAQEASVSAGKSFEAAASSAQQAGQYMGSATSSASAAQKSQQAASVSEANAAASATAASESATAAKTSETNAAASAANAQDSATNATQKAADAEAAEGRAQDAANDAENAKTAAETASATATGKAEEASASAQAAASSATKAAASAEEAKAQVINVIDPKQVDTAASGAGGLAIGNAAECATGNSYGIAIGTQAAAKESYGIAIGTQAAASKIGTVAIGSGSGDTENVAGQNVCIGDNAKAETPGCAGVVVLGAYSKDAGVNTVSVGSDTVTREICHVSAPTKDDSAMTKGYADANYAVNIIAPKSVSTGASARDDTCVVVGLNSKAVATQYSVAIGPYTIAGGFADTVLGPGSQTITQSNNNTGMNVAVGREAMVIVDGVVEAVALGGNSKAVKTREFSIGAAGIGDAAELTREITHVGEPTADSSAATKHYVDALCGKQVWTASTNDYVSTAPSAVFTRLMEVTGTLTAALPANQVCTLTLTPPEGVQNTLIEAHASATLSTGALVSIASSVKSTTASCIVNVSSTQELAAGTAFTIRLL